MAKKWAVMKKIAALIIAGSMVFTLAACGDSSSSGEKEVATVPDLTGEWTQANSDSDDSYQAAVITEDTIEIYWISDGGDTKALYWAGTFIPPTTADEPYTWDSENDHDQTDSALLASGDDTKTFTYEDNQISYEGSILGTTTTYRLEKTAELSESDLAAETAATSFGTDADEVTDLIPDEDKYDHGLDEEATKGQISVAASLMFKDANEDTFPNLTYSSDYTYAFGMVAWTFTSEFEQIAKGALDGDESSINAWNSMRELMLSLSNLAETTLAISVSEDYHCLIMLLDDEGSVVMAAYNNELIYDAAADVPASQE